VKKMMMIGWGSREYVWGICRKKDWLLGVVMELERLLGWLISDQAYIEDDVVLPGAAPMQKILGGVHGE
jgi:hypothetical protein